MSSIREEKKKKKILSTTPTSSPAPDGPPSHWLDPLTNFYPISLSIYWSISILFALQSTFTALIQYICSLSKRRPKLDTLKSPYHVALAGCLNDPPQVSRLALLLQRCGTAELSIAHESSAEIEKACAQAGVNRLRIRVITQSSSTTPRQMVVRGARSLSTRPNLTRDEIIELLDDWHCKNHLSSEPDVVVLIGTRRNSFPPFSCWQLRLSQFRFISTPLRALSDRQFLDAVCSATKVAKRFGR